jgi:GntR family transcriptional regulator
VRQLATELRITPNTVQQAYRELEREGVVYVLRGRGTFASAQEEREEEQRLHLLSAVAERALLDAHRNGLNAEELIEAIRVQARDFNAGDPK